MKDKKSKLGIVKDITNNKMVTMNDIMSDIVDDKKGQNIVNNKQLKPVITIFNFTKTVRKFLPYHSRSRLPGRISSTLVLCNSPTDTDLYLWQRLLFYCIDNTIPLSKQYILQGM